MTQEDEKWLATEIVRCAERWPDRIGASVMYAYSTAFGAHVGDRCIMGEIGQVDCHYGWGVARAAHIWSAATSGVAGGAASLCRRAVKANDDRVRWGEIPKLLGLVPGEADAQDLDSLDGVDRGRLSAGVPAVSEPAPDGVALVEV